MHKMYQWEMSGCVVGVPKLVVLRVTVKLLFSVGKWWIVLICTSTSSMKLVVFPAYTTTKKSIKKKKRPKKTAAWSSAAKAIGKANGKVFFGSSCSFIYMA